MGLSISAWTNIGCGLARERSYRSKAAIFLVLIIPLLPSSAQAKYNGGTGEPNDPYRIATPNDFNDIGKHIEDYNKHFVMVNDINLAGFTYTTALIAADRSSSGGFQGTSFTGIFDGNDCRISNLTIDTAGQSNWYLGLFGQIKESGRVKNLGIEDVNITGGDGSWYLGGLCGYNFQGTISECYATGEVTSGDDSRNLGGLCGRNEPGTISNSYATGSVAGGDNSDSLGGLCGTNIAGTIIYCYATGSVTAGSNSVIVGGLCGDNHYKISNCYATGSVIGHDRIGGLCGMNCYTISNCYATGRISGSDGSECVGAVVGEDAYKDGVYLSCFWNTDVNPDVNGIGNMDDPNVTGKTTVEMMTESTFTDAGWDFVEVWDIGENQTYPFLRVYPAGDLNHDGLVDWRDVAIVALHWLEGG